MQNNLTSLANVTSWLKLSTTTDTALLTLLIAASSRAILTHLERPSVFLNTYSEVRDGGGNKRLILRNWPVLSVTTLTIGTQTVPLSTGYGQTGFALEAWDGYPPGSPQALNLFGYSFYNEQANVGVTYSAGYVIQGEAQTIPASPYQITAKAPHGSWAVDNGVQYTNGTAMTPVTGAPSVGQYSVSNGVYTFSASDAGQIVMLTYSYIPASLEQACMELVGERYRTRERIGEKSKTLGGQETVAYDTSSLNPYVREMLQPYKRVILC